MKIANAALKGKPLTATDAEGGKWSDDAPVTKNGKCYEAEVDATTGKAAKPETMTVAEEARAMASDLSKAMGKTAPAGAKEENDQVSGIGG